MVRREIRRANRIAIDEERLVSGLKELFSVEARDAMGPIKVKRRRRRKAKALQATAEGPPNEKTASADAAGSPGSETKSATASGNSDS